MAYVRPTGICLFGYCEHEGAQNRLLWAMLVWARLWKGAELEKASYARCLLTHWLSHCGVERWIVQQKFSWRIEETHRPVGTRWGTEMWVLDKCTIEWGGVGSRGHVACLKVTAYPPLAGCCHDRGWASWIQAGAWHLYFYRKILNFKNWLASSQEKKNTTWIPQNALGKNGPNLWLPTSLA